MKAFRVNGSLMMGREWHEFSKEVAAKDKDAAINQIFSVFGSKHRVTRAKIKIDKVDEVKDIENPVVERKVRESKAKTAKGGTV